MDTEDPRIDLVRLAQKAHMVSLAASSQASGGEQWKCRCGVHYGGEGAIEMGRRHEVAVILDALDSAKAAAGVL